MPFKEYENLDELKHLQNLSVMILGELDRVCEALDIPYVVWAGTALGAVRHQGFIPWDDDVDVAIPREHYERFLSEAPALLDDRFEIASMRTVPDFTSPYSYLTLKGTYCIPEFYKACSYRKPISIDVFPLDKVSDDPATRKRQLRGTWLWGRLIFLRATPAPYLSIEGITRTLVLAACSCAHWAMRILRITPQALQKRWEKAARAAENESVQTLADFSDRSPLSWSAAIDELFPAIIVPFDGAHVKLPAAYDALLSREYGDYMTLPPVEKRKNHYPHLLDFGPYGMPDSQE